MKNKEITDIRWDIKAHDRDQLELVFDYSCQGLEQGPKGKRFSHFELDVFFFFPRGLSLFEGRYPKQSFERDFRNQMRFHTPSSLLVEKFHFRALNSYLALGLNILERHKLLQGAIYEVKIFSNSFNRDLKNAPFKEKASYSKESYATQIASELKRFREGPVKRILREKELLDPSLVRAVLFADEYISGRYLFFFLPRISRNEEWGRELTALENMYRKQNADRMLDLACEEDREEFYHRYGRLKKYISEILYIKKKEVKKGKFYKNLVASSGAGLAALWSQFAHLEGQASGALSPGNTNLYVMGLIGVVIYISKDRIKDLSKEYFSGQLDGRLPHKEYLLKFNAKGERQKTITLAGERDYTYYLKKDQLPQDIRSFRKRSLEREQSIVLDEDIIHYKKKIMMMPRAYTPEIGSDVRLKDIFRFNLGHFKNFFDDPYKELSLFDDDGPRTIKTPKYYYFDIVLRAKHRAGGKQQSLTPVTYRLVLNKHGIVKVRKAKTLKKSLSANNWISQ